MLFPAKAFNTENTKYTGNAESTKQDLELQLQSIHLPETESAQKRP